MKKEVIPFSLTEYQKGGYELYTRGSETIKPRKARIICTDSKCVSGPIIALMSNEGDDKESGCFYTKDGICLEHKENYLDLCLVKFEFEDGDIISFEDEINTKKYIGIFKSLNVESSSTLIAYIIIYEKRLVQNKLLCCQHIRPATEGEKQNLYDALAKEGKRWNAEKKCIEDIKPKFEFKPFDKVLVRNFDSSVWIATYFSDMVKDEFRICDGTCWKYCIPYNDETKHLLGTADDAPEKYIIW